MDDSSDVKKGHRPRKAGPKAQKKKSKQKHDQDLTARQRNPKAFAIQSVKKAERSFRRTADIKTKKQHIPKVDRSPLEPPPLVIAVIGPPKVGKSTLIKGLIKNFTKQRLTNIQGPVTVVAGKNRRLTFIECNNDINCMIDVGKIADLALLMVDAKQGFEMEIFEFFNVCQAIGFPRCMGVLNHLDTYKDGKAVRKRKTQLKHRFEVELYKGARLFYLSMLVHGEYLPNEVHNLCRFISVMKMTPLSWRATHPYIFADRMEDITNPELIRQNPKCDRTVSMYGYVRGTHMKSKSMIHLAGCGDYIIKNMTFLHDPCPTPDMEKRRSLNKRERVIYAPMSGVGGIVYDKDAVYIDLGHHHRETEEKPTGMVAALMDTLKTVDEKMKDSQISIFKGGPSISGLDFIRRRPGDQSDEDGDDSQDEEKDSGLDDDDDDDDESGDSEEESSSPSKKKVKLNNDENDEEESMEEGEDDDDDEEDEDAAEEERGHLEWKKNMFERAKMGKSRRKNYFKMIYGEDSTTMGEEKDGDEDEDDLDLGGLFTVLKKGASGNTRADKHAINKKDSSRSFSQSDLAFDELKDEIQDTFMSGKWQASDDAETRLREDDEMYGDFEDLETGEMFQAEEGNDDDNAEGAGADEGDEEGEGDDDNDDEDKPQGEEKAKTKAEKTAKEKRLERKRKIKERFDAEYDNKGDDAFYDALKAEADLQSKMNRAEFEELPEEQRVQYEGFRPGMYVRVEFEQMPSELVDNFNPQYPLIIGGMTNVEEKLGYVNVRIKKHRWYKKILKSRNPLILSLGWRRFQTIPYYYKLGDNMRRRMLKYTPQHIHCHASFWGPITPQGTGFLAVESVSTKTADFRIAATGIVLEMDKTTEVEKKLKLVGTPTKIFKKSAFIENMFSSSLEVAKFQGASIQTVSRLRGQIKKAIRAPPGAFRATFEDQIRLSDIVFLKAWVKVEIPQFIMPVTSLLLSHDAKEAWNGMRTIGTLRHERGIPVPQKQDSMYKTIERRERYERPLHIPTELKKNLPFKDTPKHKAVVKEPQRVAVVLEPKEAKIANFVKRVKEVYKHKVASDKQYKRKRAQDFGKRKEKEDVIRQQKLKEAKKRLHKILGDLEKRKDFKK